MKIVKFFMPFMFITLKIMFWHRVSHFFYNRGFKKIALLVEGFILRVYGVAISSQAEIGKDLKFPHPVGIVIGANVRIGDNVIIYQNVTIGKNNINAFDYPVIGSNTIIYANSIVIGGIKIGENCIVGAQSLVKRSMNDNETFK